MTRPCSSSLLDERGSAFVEYLVVTALFGLVVAGAVVALGFPLLRLYRVAAMALSLPVP